MAELRTIYNFVLLPPFFFSLPLIATEGMMRRYLSSFSLGFRRLPLSILFLPFFPFFVVLMESGYKLLPPPPLSLSFVWESIRTTFYPYSLFSEVLNKPQRNVFLVFHLFLFLLPFFFFFDELGNQDNLFFPRLPLFSSLSFCRRRDKRVFRPFPFLSSSTRPLLKLCLRER